MKEFGGLFGIAFVVFIFAVFAGAMGLKLYELGWPRHYWPNAAWRWASLLVVTILVCLYDSWLAITGPPHALGLLILSGSVICVAFAVAPCGTPRYNHGLGRLFRNSLVLLLAFGGVILAANNW